MVLRWLTRIPRRHPVAFGCCFSAAKTSAADLVCQTQIEGRELKDVDWRRTSIFGVWGFAYLGGVQYFIYSFAFPRAFPSAIKFIEQPLRAKLRNTAGQLSLLKQVGVDQFLHHPFVLFPAFYCVKEYIEGGTPSMALEKYQANWREDCVVTWKVWVPAFLVNFSVCPLWMRVPFVAVVSFGYTMYWSFLRGAPQQTEENDEG